MLLDIILHLDTYLAGLSASMGPWLYCILFLIIFCETGLVVTPFLPGDSLLFAIGALAALPESQLNIIILAVILVLAAIIGDNTNYALGRWIGGAAFSNPNSKIFKRVYFIKAQEFYARHGARAQIIARFAPIFRTFVPFVAGVAVMSRARFALNSVIGGLLWINLFLWAGYYFGNMPEVKSRFHIVIFAVILISLLPMLIQLLSHRRKQQDHI